MDDRTGMSKSLILVSEILSSRVFESGGVQSTQRSSMFQNKVPVPISKLPNKTKREGLKQPPPTASSDVESLAGSITSLNSLDGDRVALLQWLNGVPFTRPRSMKINMIHREFSDGILMAELISHFFPRLIEMHNYAPANKVSAKKNNWGVLNRKVLPKLGIRLPETTVDALCNARPGVIDPILCQIKKLLVRKTEQEERVKDQAKRDISGGSFEEARCNLKISPTDHVEYIEYKGRKFTPEESFVEKVRQNEELKTKVKELTNKTQRLETMISLKESHLEDLTKQVHELRVQIGESSNKKKSGGGGGDAGSSGFFDRC